MASGPSREDPSDDDNNSSNNKASLRLDLKRILDWDKVQWVTKSKGQFPCTGCPVVLASQTEQRGHRRDCIGYALVKAGLQEPVEPDFSLKPDGTPRSEPSSTDETHGDRRQTPRKQEKERKERKPDKLKEKSREKEKEKKDRKREKSKDKEEKRELRQSRDKEAEKEPEPKEKKEEKKPTKELLVPQEASEFSESSKNDMEFDSSDEFTDSDHKYYFGSSEEEDTEGDFEEKDYSESSVSLRTKAKKKVPVPLVVRRKQNMSEYLEWYAQSNVAPPRKRTKVKKPRKTITIDASKQTNEPISVEASSEPNKSSSPHEDEMQIEPKPIKEKSLFSDEGSLSDMSEESAEESHSNSDPDFLREKRLYTKREFKISSPTKFKANGKEAPKQEKRKLRASKSPLTQSLQPTITVAPASPPKTPTITVAPEPTPVLKSEPVPEKTTEVTVPVPQEPPQVPNEWAWAMPVTKSEFTPTNNPTPTPTPPLPSSPPVLSVPQPLPTPVVTETKPVSPAPLPLPVITPVEEQQPVIKEDPVPPVTAPPPVAEEPKAVVTTATAAVPVETLPSKPPPPPKKIIQDPFADDPDVPAMPKWKYTCEGCNAVLFLREAMATHMTKCPLYRALPPERAGHSPEENKERVLLSWWKQYILEGLHYLPIDDQIPIFPASLWLHKQQQGQQGTPKPKMKRKAGELDLYESPQPAKRGRGRPPKPKDTVVPGSTVLATSIHPSVIPLTAINATGTAGVSDMMLTELPPWNTTTGLPGSTQDPTVKRKRGRPPKVKTPLDMLPHDGLDHPDGKLEPRVLQPGEEGDGVVIKRKRGRPPKQRPEGDVPKEKRKRGRPPKDKSMKADVWRDDYDSSEDKEHVKRKRGRPRKEESDLDFVKVAGKRGRPKKEFSLMKKRRRLDSEEEETEGDDSFMYDWSEEAALVPGAPLIHSRELWKTKQFDFVDKLVFIQRQESFPNPILFGERKSNFESALRAQCEADLVTRFQELVNGKFEIGIKQEDPLHQTVVTSH